MKLNTVLKAIASLVIITTITFGKNTISISRSNNIENHNKEILEKVETLQNLAQEYINRNGIVDKSATDLCMQYIRKDRYNSELWKYLLGNVDKNFVTFIEGKGSKVTFKNEVLHDPSTGKEIDFVHMIAALNAYLKNGDKITGFMSTDYAGWGGDLATLLEEITVYKIENNIVEKDKLQEYCNSLLGTNNKSTFSSSDMLADLDAIALYKDGDNKIRENLYNALYRFYIKNDSRYNSNNRLLTAQTILGPSKEIVKEKAKALLTNADVTNSLFQNISVASHVTADDIDIASQSFANYVYGVPYLMLQESKGNVTIEQAPIDVKIIESNVNLKNSKIEIENSKIAKAEICGEYLRIVPLAVGKTMITLYSEDKAASTTYELLVLNVAPSITKNLDEIYKLTVNVEKIFSLEADGTNNIYSWYIKNSTEEIFKKVAESYENTYKIVPTLEMNNTYIRCGIKNNGNEEIFSINAKIVVSESNDKENDNANQDNIIDDAEDKENDNIVGDKLPENDLMIYPDAGNKKGILLFIPVIFIFALFFYRKIQNINEYN